MKTKILLIMAAGLVLLTGCVGPYFKDRAQYDQGHWYGVAGNRDVRQMNRDQLATERDRLALDKLRTAPAQTLTTNGVSLGYEGLIINQSEYNACNFMLSGPETKSYMLSAGQRIIDHLIPGEYTCRTYRGVTKVGEWTFHVGPQQSFFIDQWWHFYVYYTDRQ